MESRYTITDGVNRTEKQICGPSQKINNNKFSNIFIVMNWSLSELKATMKLERSGRPR